jgi:hypothetical protein
MKETLQGIFTIASLTAATVFGAALAGFIAKCYWLAFLVGWRML